MLRDFPHTAPSSQSVKFILLKPLSLIVSPEEIKSEIKLSHRRRNCQELKMSVTPYSRNLHPTMYKNFHSLYDINSLHLISLA